MPSTRVQLAEAIDRVMHKGAVLRGDVMISVAGVDLMYLDLRVILSSVDTAMRQRLINRPPTVEPLSDPSPARETSAGPSSAADSPSTDRSLDS
jgi:gas vesicle structural protein